MPKDIFFKIQTDWLFWIILFIFFLCAIRFFHQFALKRKKRKKGTSEARNADENDTVTIGKRGETEVLRVLTQTRSSHKKIINDIVIKTAEDQTSQIDHILINEAGIFVLETKNYKGAIYGTEKGFHWCQYLNGKKFIFYNPVKQNAVHIKRLKSVLGNAYPYYSVIVFAKNNTKKIDADNVVDLKDLADYIHSHEAQSLSKQEIRKIYKRLLYIKRKKYVSPLWVNDAA